MTPVYTKSILGNRYITQSCPSIAPNDLKRLIFQLPASIIAQRCHQHDNGIGECNLTRCCPNGT